MEGALSKGEWIEKLMNQYSKSLIRYAVSIVRDFEVAKEVVEACFMQLLNESDRAVHLHLQGWLYRQCRQQAFDAWRKLHPTSAGFYANPLKSHDTSLLQEEIRKLSSKSQEILWLKYHEGLSYRQIAEITSLPIEDVGITLFNAVMNLKTNAQLADTSKVVVAVRTPEPATPPAPAPTSEDKVGQKRKW